MCSLSNIFKFHSRCVVLDVFSEGSIKQNGILENNSEVRSERVYVVLPDIEFIYCDVASVLIVESQQDLHDCRLSTATRTHEG